MADPRVLVTRAAEDAPSLANPLKVAGFEPVIVPLLERIWRVEELASTIRASDPFDWVLLTSAASAQILAIAGGPRANRIAAVGPATARACQQLGWKVDLVPARATAADLAAAGTWTGLRVLYPRADLAGPRLAEALQKRGAQVTDVVAYENRPPAGHEQRLIAALPVYATALMSGSAAERIAAVVPEPRRSELGHVVAAGPSTRDAAEKAGLTVSTTANPHTAAGMAHALSLLRARS